MEPTSLIDTWIYLDWTNELGEWCAAKVLSFRPPTQENEVQYDVSPIKWPLHFIQLYRNRRYMRQSVDQWPTRHLASTTTCFFEFHNLERPAFVPKACIVWNVRRSCKILYMAAEKSCLQRALRLMIAAICLCKSFVMLEHTSTTIF